MNSLLVSAGLVLVRTSLVLGYAIYCWLVLDKACLCWSVLVYAGLVLV